MSDPAMTARAATALLEGWRPPSPDPAFSLLADALRLLVLDGRVPVGVRLPAERQLAASLGVSRATVARAYAILREDGYLASTRGSGSSVRLPERDRASTPGSLSAPAGAGMLDLRRTALPAAPGVADAARRAMQVLPSTLAQPGYDTVGDEGLRDAVAARYSARGLPTTPDQILVTLGAQHAIGLLARTLVAPRASVLIESPTYPHALAAFREAGTRPVAIPVHAEAGWDGDLLLESLRRVRPAAAYLMPDLQNPTGATMASRLRTAVLEAAARSGTTVIADETVGELRIDGVAEPPLASLGPAVLIGSASKTFWGALRIGWIRAEPDLLRRVLEVRSRRDLGTPLLDQLVVRELVPDTAAALAARRAQLRRARDRLVGALRDAAPEWGVPLPDGGLSTWVHLGRPDSARITGAARRDGVLLAPGSAFAAVGSLDRHLRVPFLLSEADRDRAVAALLRARRVPGGGEVDEGEVIRGIV